MNKFKKYFYELVFFFFLMISLIHLVMSLYMMKNNLFFLVEYVINLKILGGDMKMFFLLDWVSMMFMFVVYFISSMISMYSKVYMMEDKNKIKFLYILILFVISMNLMVMSPNMIMILLGWDGLGLVSYCLVIFYNNENSSAAGMITVMSNRLGDSGIILSIVLMMNFGGWSFFEYGEEKKSMFFLSLMVMLGAFTKSAQIPFSAWLPAAMAAPTPVSALVHSSTLVTAGVYLIIRLNYFFLMGEVQELMMILSIMTMFMSGLGALFEMDLKKIIALSTLSQLGVMMMILSLGKWELAFFHLCTHAMFKAMLFMCAGMVIHSMNNWQDIRNLSNISLMSPFISMSMMIGSLSLLGFPFLSGFYSKDLILEMMYFMNNSFILFMMIILGTLFTVLYSLRLIYYINVKEKIDSMMSFKDANEMVYAVMSMNFIVVLLGSVLMWLFLPLPFFIYLKMNIKVINLFLVIMGVVIYMMFFSEVVYFKKSNFFFSKMWYLDSITSLVLMVNLSVVKSYSKNSEMWFEKLGALGIKEELESISLMLFQKMVNFLTMVLILFFLVMLIFI
nr:NADH dehydrogenase subunit 5 [Hypoaspis sp. 3 JO-2023a]